jgi:signal peptidase I
MREIILDGKQLDTLVREILPVENSLRFTITVTGSCMLPFIRHGDILTVAPVQSSLLHIGDIIVYRNSWKQLFAHRLVTVKKNNGTLRLETRGDATFGYKENVDEKQILGRVIGVHRKGKLLNLNHPCHRITALLWITGSPITTFILYLMRRVRLLYTAH